MIILDPRSDRKRRLCYFTMLLFIELLKPYLLLNIDAYNV